MADVLKYAEIKDWDDKTIDAKVMGLRKEIFDLRMQKMTSNVSFGHKVSIAKKTIARLLTAKSQRRIEESLR